MVAYAIQFDEGLASPSQSGPWLDGHMKVSKGSNFAA